VRDEDGDVLASAAAALRTSPVATDDVLAHATDALRDVSPALPPEVAATRVRVMASLERRGRGRNKRVVVAAVLATIGTGTLSWAAATGRMQRVLEAITEPTDAGVQPWYGPPTPARDAVATKQRGHRGGVEVAVAEPAPPPVVEAPLQTTTTPELIPVPEGATAVDPAPAPAPPPPRPARRPVKKPEVVDDAVDRDLYRRAHELHFHGGDAATALAAWDRYLAERPAGRFAIEARWNRALVLFRLDRRDDARAALAPFADGSVEPAGYRQRDARELLGMLERDAERDALPEGP
jgi:hypothetical protein